jgi:hypothetical protein
MIAEVRLGAREGMWANVRGEVRTEGGHS